MNRYCLGFCFDETETVLALLLKASPEWQRGHLNGVGGHIEEGESSEEAMEREWDEEVTVRSPQWRLFCVLSGDGWVVHCFRGSADLAGAESMSDGESLVLVDPLSLPANVIPNLTWLVPMARMRNRHDWPFMVRERATMEPEKGGGR